LDSPGQLELPSGIHDFSGVGLAAVLAYCGAMTSSRFAKPFALLAMCTLMLVGCSSKNNNGPKQPQCSDGKDNDGDGLVDFPEDPGCTSATDDTEDSQPAPQCSD